MVSCYFVQLLLQNGMPLFYANREKYITPWSEVDQVFVLINETGEHWCLAQFHIMSREVTFYDMWHTYDYDYRGWLTEKLASDDGSLFENPERYRRLVGRLIYLSVTRPKLSYGVHLLAQFMQQPRVAYWEAALRVVRYLKGCPRQGILLHIDNDLQLYGWCDYDWAACPLTRRSLTGYFVQLGKSPISWKTKKQHTVSRSSAEAEYRSMATITCELKWLKALLLSLGVSHSRPMKLYCDSQAALHIAANPVFHERTKHIEVDCHFIRDEILRGTIRPTYVPTQTQLADNFTKALGTRQFRYFLGKLGIHNLHAPT
ncbi:retrovirus-related pol polyprotein from transposon TNT 1-94 [Tanacetum coccineum]